MPTFPRERIRLQVDTDEKAGTSAIKDAITGQSPDCWKGTNVQFELGLFFGGLLIDIGNIQTLTMTAKDIGNKTGDKVLEVSISAAAMDATLTEEAWTNGTGQHAKLTFSAEEMNLDLNGQDYRELWLMIHGVSTTGDRLAFGAARLRVYETGIDGGDTSLPVAGANIIPGGAVYNGSGQYALTVEEGQVYDWSKGANDTSLVNGSETLTVSGRFTSQGVSVTLTGSIGLAVSGLIRDQVYYTAREVNALLDGVLKLVNAPGAILWVKSENERFMRGIAVTNDGDFAYPILDRDATP
jgi:hypothetical protein